MIGAKQFNYQNAGAGRSTADLPQPEWSTGIHKLMSKVQTMKKDGSKGSIVKKGRMAFGKNLESGFSEAPPAFDRYVISPYMNNRRQV